MAIPPPSLGIRGPASRDKVTVHRSPFVQFGSPWELDSVRSAMREVICESLLTNHESAL